MSKAPKSGTGENHDTLSGAGTRLRRALNGLLATCPEANPAALDGALRALESAAAHLDSERERLLSLFEEAPDAYLVTDLQGVVRQTNRVAAELLGPAGATGRHLPLLVPQGRRGSFRTHLAGVAKGRAGSWETRLKGGDGRTLDAWVRVVPAEGELRWLLRDVTERKSRERRLRLAARLITANSRELLVADPKRRIRLANLAFSRGSGYSEEELVERPVDQLLVPLSSAEQVEQERALATLGEWQGEVWTRRIDGALRRQWLTLSAVRDERGRLHSYIADFSDPDGRHERQQGLFRSAHYDSLTALPGRPLFLDRLEVGLAQTARAGSLLAVFSLRVDGFARIHNTLGRRGGDELLRQLAGRLRESVRKGDSVARVGDDEFTALMPLLPSAADSILVAEKMIGEIARPFRVAGNEIRVTGSLGVSLFPRDGDSPQQLLERADQAMECARQAGGGQFRFHRPVFTSAPWSEEELIHALDAALKGSQLTMLYQPLFDLGSGALAGIEALARWEHPRLGPIPPQTFVPLAESTGLLERFTRWQLEAACRQVREWLDSGLAVGRLSLNLTARQLRWTGFQALFESVLKRFVLTPSLLTVEVSERQLLYDGELATPVLETLHNAGVQVGIDNFGTGNTPWTAFGRLPADKVKLDRSLAERMGERPQEAERAGRAVAVAHALGLRVVAMGTETVQHLDFFRNAHCEEAQGFVFSPPVPATEIPTVLRTMH